VFGGHGLDDCGETCLSELLFSFVEVAQLAASRSKVLELDEDHPPPSQLALQASNLRATDLRGDLDRSEAGVKRRPTYREIDREEVPPGNPVDMAVHRRVGRPALMRKVANSAQAVVDALGRRRRLWFAYEEALGRLTSLQQAAYFGLGVEHGIAAARANALPGASKAARAIAERRAQEVVRTGVAREIAVEAAVLAAWAVLGKERQAVRRLRHADQQRRQRIPVS
jgi:hypothetical protein